MKNPTLIILGFFVVIVGILMWWFSDTQVIKRQTQQLAGSLSIAMTDGKIARLRKTQDFSELLALSVSCRIDIADYQSNFSHNDLKEAHHIMTHSCESSSAKVSQIEITIISDTQSTVTADLELAVIEKGGTKHGEPCKAMLTWEKNDTGKWELETIEIKSPNLPMTP